MFENVATVPADPILSLLDSYRSDRRADKLDLGVGIYRNEQGLCPILQCVKTAEMRLVEEQQTKAYLGPEGNAPFLDGLSAVIFGPHQPAKERCIGMQTPGGTGALRLASELLAMAGSAATVLVGVPSWTNHIPILQAAGLRTREYPYLRSHGQELHWSEILAALHCGRPGDVVLLQGCCHNPSGVDLNEQQWQELTEVIVSRGLIPFLDIAYHGFGESLEQDAKGVRHLFSRVEEALFAYSCSKNFGLYRDRVGALFILARNRRERERLEGQVSRLARANWSMPPDHGAAVVSLIWGSDALTAQWLQELGEMRARIAEIRCTLAQTNQKISFLSQQKGLFSQVPLSANGGAWLRSRGIYVPDSGRLNLAGLMSRDIDRLARALGECLP